MRELIGRLMAMIRRDRQTGDRQEELQFHHDMAVDAELRRGASADEAVRRARARAGLVSHGVESTHEAMGLRWLDGALADLRHAVRALTRNRGFGTVAVLVLAASVAINTLIFFMLEGVVLRPLPYRSPDRLVRVYEAIEGQPKFPMSIGRFLDYRANAKSLEAIALYTGQDMELSGADGRSQLLTGLAITSDYFSVLGRVPVLGRGFTDADLRQGTRSVVLNHRLWQDRFGSDPAIVGKAIRLDQRRKELGIRVALGASPGHLLRMVLFDGLRMAAIGALCCLVLIPLSGSMLQTFLYNVKAFDPFAVAGAPAALLAAAFLASLGPAISALRSDPSRALRED